jgi:fatty-acyl-CoA synthase
MMDVQLTLNRVLDRATTLYPDREVVTARPDGSRHRYTYADAADRIAKLAGALDDLGLEPGDRVATVALNHYRHLELYFAPPCSGRSIHMCNMRLPEDHFTYIVNDAADRVLFVDPAFVEFVEGLADDLETVEQYVVLDDSVPETSLAPVTDYESLIADQPTEYDWPDVDEDAECGMCYTSGTTGKPKGVEYSHRGVYLHSLASGHVDANGVSERDTVLPVVPMFHANGWGLPYAATLAGAKQVLPGPNTDPESVATLIDEEEVTMSAAVPTVWLEMAEYLEANPEVDVSNVDRLTVGGSAPPESLIRRYDEEFDAPIIQGWGMTEMSPLGTLSTLRKEYADAPADERYAKRATAGLPVPGVSVRVRDETGDPVARDGESMGELEARGPWVADRYHQRPGATERSFTEDGWLKTGDIATWDADGYVDVVDRIKDVIKSGGEWISSVDVENELMAHPDVAEATVVGVAHEKWQERPVAVVVPKQGRTLDPDDLEAHLADAMPSWWLPDEYVIREAIPRTSTGKFDKKRLREGLDDLTLARAPGEN